MSEFGLQWWKLACERSKEAIAFVGNDDRFRYNNLAWCKLVGWSASDLKTKRWQDITDMSSITSDQTETERVKQGLATEYYMEKAYIKPSGARVPVAILVHRFPPELSNAQLGYIVFATPLETQAEYQELKRSFANLLEAVQKLQKTTEAIEHLRDVTNSNRELIKTLIGKGEGIRMGDYVGGDKTGRDKITNDPRMLIACATVAGLALIYFVYYLFARPGQAPPPNMPAAEPQSRVIDPATLDFIGELRAKHQDAKQ